MTQRERLLFLQGNRCFFCDETIPDGEATVEHLVATANGGPNQEHNCVVCCRTLNSILGCLPLKEKLRAILRHRGRFTCPRPAAAVAPAGGAATAAPAPRVTPAPALGAAETPRVVAAPPAHPHGAAPSPRVAPAPPVTGGPAAPRFSAALITHAERLEYVVAFFHKQVKGRPTRVASLRGTVNALFHKQLGDSELDSLVAALVRRGFVKVEGERVSYARLPVG